MKLDKPLVSIGIPVYGVEKYIERCVRSLFEQTYQNIEYIFLDDCSVDKSVEIIKTVLPGYPNRVPQTRIISHSSNCGLAEARNTFIKNASGDFVLHIDSDDWVDKNLVDRLVEEQLNSNSDIVSVDYVKIYNNRKETVRSSIYSDVLKYRDEVLMLKANSHIWGRLIRRSLYLNNNISCEKGINMGEDYQVYARLVYFASKVSFISDTLYFYNCINEGSYTNMFSPEKLRQDWRSFDIVKDFYLSLGDKFKDMVQIAELKLIITDFIFSARYKQIDYYYDEAKTRLANIDKSLWKSQSLPSRFLLYVHKCKSIMFLYANFATGVKRYLKLFN